MDFWTRTFRAYLRSLGGFLQILSNRGTAAELKQLADSPEFKKWAQSVAIGLSTSAYQGNAKTWRDAAAKSGRGRYVYEQLKKEIEGTHIGAAVSGIVSENAALISSLPLNLAEQLTAYIAKRRLAGLRSKEIQAEVGAWLPKIATSRIRLICRTETSKAETALTRARSQDLGIDWYEWETSHDQRVRKSHRNMQGVLVNWNEAPQPERLIGQHTTLTNGHAGTFPNCRCLCLPIVSLDEISWPHRVYVGGSIKRLTKGQFSKLAQKAA